MTTIGYARASTSDQDRAIQEAALLAAGCDIVRTEERSDTTMGDARSCRRSAHSYARATRSW